MSRFPRVASLRTAENLRHHLSSLGVSIPIDDEVDVAALASPIELPSSVPQRTIGNRFCSLPMEGWDGTRDGQPSDLTRRRWQNFGRSGAKWIWGGEAVAAEHDGRANPNQLWINDANAASIGALRQDLVAAHRERFGRTDDLFVGLQLTHSGRWSRPDDKATAVPRVAQRNRVLDRRMGIVDDSAMVTDDEIRRTIDAFVRAAVWADKLGFSFVDIKQCHGYLGHELLTAVDRPGPYGGSLENRFAFFRETVTAIRAAAPNLAIGTRLSLFDFVPFGPGEDGVGRPEPDGDPRLSLGCDDSGVGVDLSVTDRLLTMIGDCGVSMICTTAGVPYANPHLTRPATFPPSDGYQPPEDPLVGVCRQIAATAEMKRRHPEMIFIGSGYTYLQQHVPAVGGAVIRGGMADSIGLGRMALSYPDLPADVLAGQVINRKQICRTLSDCTTAPRNGLISGCYPLDRFYKDSPQRRLLQAIKD